MNCAPEEVVIVDCNIYTAFGLGIEPAWKALVENRHASRQMQSRVPTETLGSFYAAISPELDGCETPSDFLMDAIARCLGDLPREECILYVGSTVGEIEQLNNPQKQCTSDSLLEKAVKKFNIRNSCCISAACASSNMAMCRAGAALKKRKCRYAVVYAVDYVNEFVASGFSTLKSMTAEPCTRPYDKNRSGLLLGDGAGMVVMTLAETAERNGLEILARIPAWGMSCDAGHITAPNASGEFLAEAGRKMLFDAKVKPEDVGAVIGHGTGTYHNDIMEIKALKKLFEQPVKLISTKGSTGHTLAAAGLIQTAMAVMMLKENIVPPQTSLITPEDGAEDMVSTQIRKLEKPRIISMNAGFGGLNAALLLEGVQA